MEDRYPVIIPIEQEQRASAVTLSLSTQFLDRPLQIDVNTALDYHTVGLAKAALYHKHIASHIPFRLVNAIGLSTFSHLPLAPFPY